MDTKTPSASLALAAVLLLAACAARPGGESEAGPGAAPADAGAGDGAASEEDSAMKVEVPEEVLAEIYADLEARTGAERSAVEVVRAESVTWRDSSLGCPERGKMYMQALVDGYWVVLRHAGEEYDYRANRGGAFVLCTQPDRQQPL